MIYFVLDKQSLEEGSKMSTNKSEIQNIEDIENETGKISPFKFRPFVIFCKI